MQMPIKMWNIISERGKNLVKQWMTKLNKRSSIFLSKVAKRTQELEIKNERNVVKNWKAFHCFIQCKLIKVASETHEFKTHMLHLHKERVVIIQLNFKRGIERFKFCCSYNIGSVIIFICVTVVFSCISYILFVFSRCKKRKLLSKNI